MTRKEYRKAAELIADMVNDSKVSNKERVRMANMFARFFSDDNSRFDEDRFIKACKLQNYYNTGDGNMREYPQDIDGLL